MTPIPSHYRKCFSRSELLPGIERVAQQLRQWCEQLEGDLVVLCLLRGGIFFCSDVVRLIGSSVELRVCSARSYSVADNTQGNLELDFPGGMPNVSGRSVLVVDDICETGNTLLAAKVALLKAGAVEVKAAVLIDRLLENSCIRPDYAVVHYTENHWLVGYGLDDADRYSNLPDVYAIMPEPE